MALQRDRPGCQAPALDAERPPRAAWPQGHALAPNAEAAPWGLSGRARGPPGPPSDRGHARAVACDATLRTDNLICECEVPGVLAAISYDSGVVAEKCSADGC